MSGNSDDVIVFNPLPPPIETKALWTWDTSSNWPTVISYASGQPTKSGLLPQDVKNFAGVPLVIMSPNGVATPISDTLILQWIRWAEDWIEQETGILLTQTWVAAPPSRAPDATESIGISPASGSEIQLLGQDYDLEEPGYDFNFSTAQDSGWMVQQLRWRPLKGPGPNSYSGLQNYAFIYPLLNTYYRVSAAWFVTDPDFGLIRLVPATNIQMLPLFALQLSFQGFAQNVPGGIWLQYAAGLAPSDYNAKYSFMQKLILCMASCTALLVAQGSISFGAVDMQTIVDGLSERTVYNKNGPYSGLIQSFTNQGNDCLKTAKNRVSGTSFTML